MYLPTAPVPPGPKGHFLLGVLPDIRREELDYLKRIVRDYGDVVFVRVVNHPVFVLSHPRDIEEVLLTSHSNFVKSVFLRESKALFGDGLLTSDGPTWVRQRRMLQPSFHHDRVAAYGQMMVEHAERMLDTWQDGETRDLLPDMIRLTLEIITKVLFGDDITTQTDRISDALRVFFEQFDDRFGLYLIPEWLPTPANLRYRRAIARLDGILEEIINFRRASQRDTGDILSALLRARYDDGSAISKQQLRDEMMTLLLTGHETTGLAMTWTWYLLSQHPEIEARLYEEVTSVLGDRAPTHQDMPQMPLVDAVMKESLRLYPPAYGIVRQAVKDCELGGYRVPAGASLAIFPWTVHRDPRFFDRPEEFIPDRWADGLAKRLPRCAYFPFSVGPRVCIGNAFATIETALLLAVMVRRFQFTLAPGQNITLNPTLTLRPRPGIKVILKKRSAQPPTPAHTG